ncbi:transcriptional antiterminator BglG [Paenibacillus sp. HJL G12]|uniref:Transcriptional antiterminator BglG n=1 Tax=Paenibacillus dendrobii TaxID=2691084 RepID=A0A7X3LHU1_9BACL|nr:helix-turn-helix domain-containing protein [Paenibacillus dendrobii]MWV43913.1 transcriptional antiterminator BglG [Paenibacillus dendrobii]
MNKEYRQLKSLLHLLDREERWFTFAEIEKELGISGKSVKRIVEEAVTLLPASMQIEVSRGKGIIFYRDRHGTTVREVLASLFRETSYFRLMQLVLTKDGEASAEEMAEALFMSFSSFKKWIIHLNQEELRPFHLRMTYSSPTLKGNEIHIRYFLWKLFTEAFPTTGWPFSGIDDQQLDGWVTEIERESGMIYFLNSKRNLSFLMAIVVERVRRGHGISLKGGSYAWEHNLFYGPVTRLSEKLMHRYQIHLTCDEVYFLQSMFSLSQYHVPDGNLRNEGQEWTADKGNEEECLMVDLLITLLTRAFPALNAGDRFRSEVAEFIDKLRIDHAIPELMAVSRSHLTSYIEQAEQPIFKTVSECMSSWEKSYPAISYNDYHLTKLTFMISSSLRYRSKKAFLIVGEEFSVRHYVAKLIKREIGDDLTIETSILHGLTDEIVAQHQIDFIISTIPVSLTSIPTVIISTIPTKRDLENIRQELLI